LCVCAVSCCQAQLRSQGFDSRPALIDEGRDFSDSGQPIKIEVNLDGVASASDVLAWYRAGGASKCLAWLVWGKPRLRNNTTLPRRIPRRENASRASSPCPAHTPTPTPGEQTASVFMHLCVGVSGQLYVQVCPMPASLSDPCLTDMVGKGDPLCSPRNR